MPAVGDSPRPSQTALSALRPPTTAAEREALELLAEIVRTGGERNVWSGYQATLWTTLLAASTASIERGIDTFALPGFGWPITNWSPDVREAYCAGVENLKASASVLTDLTLLARTRREIAVRTAVCREWRSGTRWAIHCWPVFNDSADAARCLSETAAPHTAAVLAQALVDRAGLAAADNRFDRALSDLTEASHVRTNGGNQNVGA
jgi:hypothetical protein